MISIKNDEETLRAILGLTGNPGFERILWWFRSSFEKEMEGLDFSTTQGIYKTGAIQQLHQILKNIHDARAILDAISKAQQTTAGVDKILQDLKIK